MYYTRQDSHQNICQKEKWRLERGLVFLEIVHRLNIIFIYYECFILNYHLQFKVPFEVYIVYDAIWFQFCISYSLWYLTLVIYYHTIIIQWMATLFYSFNSIRSVFVIHYQIGAYYKDKLYVLQNVISFAKRQTLTNCPRLTIHLRCSF